MNSHNPRHNRVGALAQEGTRIPQLQGELRQQIAVTIAQVFRQVQEPLGPKGEVPAERSGLPLRWCLEHSGQPRLA